MNNILSKGEHRLTEIICKEVPFDHNIFMMISLTFVNENIFRYTVKL